MGEVEALFARDLLIVGGGVSRKHAKFIPLLSRHTLVVRAQLLNEVRVSRRLGGESAPKAFSAS